MVTRNDMQALVDGLNAQWQRARAETQMTLGGLISALEAMPQDSVVIGLGGLDSYRGYYCDLAFEPTTNSVTVAALLAECRGAMGKVFGGYKGGNYVMGELTPLWVASWGDCGNKLVGLNGDGTIATASDED